MLVPERGSGGVCGGTWLVLIRAGAVCGFNGFRDEASFQDAAFGGGEPRTSSWAFMSCPFRAERSLGGGGAAEMERAVTVSE